MEGLYNWRFIRFVGGLYNGRAQVEMKFRLPTVRRFNLNELEMSPRGLFAGSEAILVVCIQAFLFAWVGTYLQVLYIE